MKAIGVYWQGPLKIGEGKSRSKNTWPKNKSQLIRWISYLRQYRMTYWISWGRRNKLMERWISLTTKAIYRSWKNKSIKFTIRSRQKPQIWRSRTMRQNIAGLCQLSAMKSLRIAVRRVCCMRANSDNMQLISGRGRRSPNFEHDKPNHMKIIIQLFTKNQYPSSSWVGFFSTYFLFSRGMVWKNSRLLTSWYWSRICSSRSRI